MWQQTRYGENYGDYYGEKCHRFGEKCHRFGEKFGENYGDYYEKTTEKIVRLMKSNPYITNKEFAEVCGITEDGVY